MRLGRKHGPKSWNAFKSQVHTLEDQRQAHPQPRSETELQQAGGAHQPTHVVLPELPKAQGPIFFECTLFMYSVFALALQYINLYKTMWWVPKSYVHHKLKFHLIDPHVCSCLGLILGRRVIWTFLVNLPIFIADDDGSLPVYLRVTEWSLKLPMLCATASSFGFSLLRVVAAYSWWTLFHLVYPLFVYAFLFHAELLRALNEASWKDSLHQLYMYISEPSGEPEPSVPRHVCSGSPHHIRHEVDLLNRDLSQKCRQSFFAGFALAFYAIYAPSCFTPRELYVDSWWVWELWLVVLLTAVTHSFAHQMTLHHCDALHRCAQHLGAWQRLDAQPINAQHAWWVWKLWLVVLLTAVTHSFAHQMTLHHCDALHRCAQHLGAWQRLDAQPINAQHAWSDSQLWPEGTIVKYEKHVYKAVGAYVAAEPGNTDHYRFYKLASDPIRIPNSLCVATSMLILVQFLMLVHSTDWQHIVTLLILVWGNYFVLFKVFRDKVILNRIYNPSPEDLAALRR